MYNLPARFFLASGRFVLKKNLFRLLEAFALYRKSLSDGDAVDLVVLGDGQLRGELEVSIQKLCLRKHVHLPGFRQYDELPVYYSLAEAFIHPSTVEPWGLVVNEAMASGLPVIVSDRCGCAGELVHPGINGFIFDPTQVDALAELIAVVGASSFLRVDFGRAGQRIIASWGPERFANGLLSAVEKALDVGPKKAGPTDRFLLELLCRR